MPDEPDLLALVRAANKGDADALAELRQALAVPGAIEKHGVNIVSYTRTALLKQFTGDGLATVVRKQMATMRAELAGPQPTATERLLAERAVCCWLHVQYLEHVFATNVGRSPTQRSFAIFERAMSAAHRRYMSALNTLAVVRRLVGPTVQVNIADRQVNVLAAGRTTPSPPSVSE